MPNWVRKIRHIWNARVWFDHSCNSRGHMSDQAVENVPNKANPKKDTKIEKPPSKKLKREVVDEEEQLPEEIENESPVGDEEPSDSDITINKFKQLHSRVGQIFRVMANGK